MTRVAILALSFAVTSCVATVKKPCLEGGQLAREKPTGGTRQCIQVRDKATGKYLNEGTYREWWPNGQLAIEGEYKEGKKEGLWNEWDESGKKTSRRWFNQGVEVPDRTSVAK